MKQQLTTEQSARLIELGVDASKASGKIEVKQQIDAKFYCKQDAPAFTLTDLLALTLVKEIIARKQRQHIVPAQALHVEINRALTSVLDTLVADGSLTRHDTLNDTAYAIPPTIHKS